MAEWSLTTPQLIALVAGTACVALIFCFVTRLLWRVRKERQAVYKQLITDVRTLNQTVLGRNFYSGPRGDIAVRYGWTNEYECHRPEVGLERRVEKIEKELGV